MKNCQQLFVVKSIGYHKFKTAYQKYNAMCESFKNVFWTPNIIINIIKCQKFFGKIQKTDKWKHSRRIIVI